jgi:hypothetical protein
VKRRMKRMMKQKVKHVRSENKKVTRVLLAICLRGRIVTPCYVLKSLYIHNVVGALDSVEVGCNLVDLVVIQQTM